MDSLSQVVVGAAVVHGGRVLAARRTSPPEAAGRWELPGGKVEAGEAYDAALVREIREELGCSVSVVSWLPPASVIRPGLILRVAHCVLASGEPVALEHDLLRWLGPHELGDVDWLGPDLPFLPALGDLLAP